MKLRVIINGVSLYTTPNRILKGIGDFSSINTVCQLALADMDPDSVGLCRTYKLYDGKMKKTEITVQISKV